jgi:hypothetical protein
MMAFEDGSGGVRRSYSSFVPARTKTEMAVILMCYQAMAEISAERIRIQNLRFAHFLCGAQEMSGVIKCCS